MENDVEEQSNRDEMKQVSNRKLPNTRSNGRCCFGFLSLRSGIFAVSAINFVCLWRMNYKSFYVSLHIHIIRFTSCTLSKLGPQSLVSVNKSMKIKHDKTCSR